MRTTRTVAALGAAAIAITLAACTAADAEPGSTASATSGAPEAPSEVTLVTHDSFYLPEDLIASFEAETGFALSVVAPGDAGALVNQLVLTQDAPLGDVVYGVDNTFASRAVEAGVFEGNLAEVDYSDVCLNYDLAFFADSSLEPPATIADIATPEYAPLTSVTNPATSSPGLAFLLATVAAMPDDWEGFWADAAGNGIRVTASWSDTYYTDFSAPNYGGDYPIVLSYASSPPFEVVDGEPTTAALLDTCFRQVEYAGVLANAANPSGAEAVVDWLLSDEVQAALPESMYVYPAVDGVDVPADWAAYAPLAESPFSVDPAEIDANREAWIETWTDLVIG